jgi:hypothetical protein
LACFFCWRDCAPGSGQARGLVADLQHRLQLAAVKEVEGARGFLPEHDPREIVIPCGRFPGDAQTDDFIDDVDFSDVPAAGQGGPGG